MKSLPVKPVRIAAHYGLRCRTDTSHTILKAGEYGRIMRLSDDTAVILLDGTQPRVRQRYTAAHEIGHFLLGHIGKPSLHMSGGYAIRPEQEVHADFFADSLLAPLCVLWACRIVNGKDIAAMCCVPSDAAQRAAERVRAMPPPESKLEQIVMHHVRCK